VEIPSLIRILFNILSGRTSLRSEIRSWQFRRRYGHRDRFDLTVGGETFTFTTRHSRSKLWFFPRYDGGRLHEAAVIRLLIKHLETARCFADIGACLGYYTCIAARFLPHGTVYAFEMDDINCRILSENLTLNRCTNAQAVHTAISDTTGEVSYDGSGRFTDFRILELSKTHRPVDLRSVKATTLDQFFKNVGVAPDIVKIDVEGAELKVLAGMADLIRCHHPKLVVEVHRDGLSSSGQSPRQVISVLEDAGYRVAEIMHAVGRKAKDTQDAQLRPLTSRDVERLLDSETAIVFATTER